MTKKRLQLTLFIDEQESATIEKIRQKFNPAQYALIKAHVTLCREDELTQIEKVLLNLENLTQAPIEINFGRVLRFSDGKGVLIPAIDNHTSFQQLRTKILQGLIEKPRIQEPHITLMHPRNATCTNEIFAHIEKGYFPQKLIFGKISLVEQEERKEWRVLREFELKN